MTERQPTTPVHVSDISFDRAFVDELPDAELQRMNAHLAECEVCRQRQRYLAEDRSAFLDVAPDFSQHRAAPVHRPRSKIWLPLSAAATALAAAFMLMSAQPRALSTRTKGGAQLGFYVKHGAQVSRGRADHVVHPGDVLRFTYSSPDPTYFALFGRDDRGATLLFPSSGEPKAFAAGSEVRLDFGVEIDAQPGTEHIYALFCAESVPLLPVAAVLNRTKELSAPAGCVARTLSLRKVVP